MDSAFLTAVVALHLITPILGLVWLGNRRENQRKDRIFNETMAAFRLIRMRKR